MIEATLLGTGGMLPLPGRWLSSLLVRCAGELTLFDCGEGTQVAWRASGWGFRRLGAICLSHYHADHVAGLPGLLHAVANAGRTEPLAVYGPGGTRRIVAALRSIAPVLPFTVEVRDLAGGERFPLPGGLAGRCAAGEHGLPVVAYRVDRHRAPRFDPDRARALGVPLALWRTLQGGEPAVWDGGRVEPEAVIGPARRGVALAYVTDTRPVPAIRSLIDGVDLLVCEGTYGDDADAAKAEARGHMTFSEAAALARAGNARRLWLTHFSPAVEDPDAFVGNARRVFAEAIVGRAGLTAAVAFDDDAPAPFPGADGGCREG
jgi:ribonuclease Z